MGFRFKKSIKAGPLRINLSKSGIGYSVGGKGFRYTKKATGGTRTTASIPGTGISYVNDSSAKKRGKDMKQTTKKSSSSKKKPFYKRWWFWPVVILLMIGSCGNNDDSEATATEPPETTIAVIETTSPAETSAPTTEPTTEPTTIPTTEPETEPPTEATEPEPVGITYVLNTNSMKFHYPSCSSAKEMSESNKWIYTGTREEVVNMGYDSCGRCHP